MYIYLYICNILSLVITVVYNLCCNLEFELTYSLKIIICCHGQLICGSKQVRAFLNVKFFHLFGTKANESENFYYTS